MQWKWCLPMLMITSVAWGLPFRAIVIPEKPLAAEQRAAEELQRYLEQSTGIRLPVTGDAGPVETPYLSVGGTRQLQGQKELPAPETLAPEELAVVPEGGNLYLYGGSRRGPLFAVYDYLAHELGVRWYTPEVTRVPKHADIPLPAAPRRSQPAFPEMRDPYGFYSHDVDWALHNRLAGPRIPIPVELGGTIQYPAGLFAHTYGRAIDADQFEAHPEYFMLDRDGKRNPLQLCPSHPVVREKMVELVEWGMRQAADPNRKVYVSVSQNDAAVCCHCPVCEALIQAEGTEAAPNLALVNFVADRLRERYPNLVVSFLAYQRTLIPPKTMKAAPNTVAWLCTDINFDREYVPIRNHKDFPGWLEGWKRAVPEVHIWDYQVNFSNYFEYRPNFPGLADNLRYFRDRGVTGVFTQQAYSSPGPERMGLRSWVFAQLLWDPTLDVAALERDYIEGVFGVAAPPVARFYRKLDAYGDRFERIPPEEYPALVVCGRECFAEAFRLAAGDPELTRLLELEYLPILMDEFNARTATLNPDDPASVAARDRVLDRIAAIAADHKVTNYSEGTLFATWLAQQRTPPAPQADSVVDGIAITRIRGDWEVKFILDEVVRQDWRELPTPSTLPDGWTRIRTDLGLGWSGQGKTGFKGTALYYNTVILPETLKYQYYYLFFGAVDIGCRAYVNGGSAGEFSSANSGLPPNQQWEHSFAFDVTRLVHGGRNEVLVDCIEAGNLGGLYMPVYVIGSDRELDAPAIRLLTQTINPYTGK